MLGYSKIRQKRNTEMKHQEDLLDQSNLKVSYSCKGKLFIMLSFWLTSVG